MIQITDTYVEYTKNPVGITKNPRFHWIMKSDRENTVQSACEIQIAEDAEFTRLVVNKKMEGRQSAHVRIPEFKPGSLTKYYYRIKVWDDAGNESGYSEPAYFITAYMDKSLWKAKFITADTEADAERSGSACLRKEFSTEKKIDHAYLCATAQGLYQVFINGQRVGEDELTPGWTSYDKHLLYQMYDVTDLMNEKGEQCIGALLGAGWYKGLMGFLDLRNNYGTRAAFLCQLHIVYTDGEEQVIGTDESWRAQDGPVVFSEIYDGEIYDARLETAGWNQPGMKEEPVRNVWRAVEAFDVNPHILYAQFGCKPAQMETFAPKRIFKTPEGDTVIDFGQNMAGWVHVRLHGTSAGDRLELRCFEELDSAGNVYTANLRLAKQQMIYTCGGREEEEYHPLFTYMGFRYAKVVSWPGSLNAEDVEARAVYSRMDQTGTFACSNPDLNQLFSNILWGLKSNFVDIPTDCPQRNERMGWTGDAQIFCRTASYLMNTWLFFEKWLIDVAMDQTPEGGVPHIVPDIITPNISKSDDWLLGQGTHSASAWGDVAVLNPWHLYLTFGDAQILEDQYESMKAWIRFMEQHANGPIWNYKLQFGDWVALDAEEGSYFGATPNDLSCTAYYAYVTGIFAKIAGILGKKEDEEYFGKLAETIREGFVEHFFDPETGGMTVQTQTAHILALYFGLTPEKYREKTVAELLDLLAKENGHLVTGFMGTPYFTHALSQNGHLKEAYELLLKDDFPSWLYQVKAGATTVWEHWDGKKPDGTMWSADMNSFNHYAYGSVGEWLIRVIAGIEWDEEHPGYERIQFYPRPGGGLTFAEGSYRSVYGTVACRWESRDEGRTLSVTCTVPVNTTASLRLDGVQGILENEAGIPARISEHTLTAELGSGCYTVTVETMPDAAK